MRLTLYTDYTLRVMMYLAMKYGDGEVVTIEEMAKAYRIPRSHLMKIVNELAQNGFIETIRGRAGGARLARAPSEISVGSLVRMAEKEFAIVQCHAAGDEADCVILPACNLRNGLRRAVDAFLYELDRMTLQDAIITPSVAAGLLQMHKPAGVQEVTVAIPSPRARTGRLPSAAVKGASRSPSTKRRPH